jgi:hypothetical protein
MTAKIAHLTLGDPIEPARQVPAVEIAQTAAHHQKDLLGDVVAIGIRAAQRANPTADLIEPFVIDPFESATTGRTSPSLSGIESALAHLNLQGYYRLHLTDVGHTSGDTFTKNLARRCDGSPESPYF